MLEAIKISKTYKPKHGPAVKALKDVSLNLEEKGLVFILGKSGSGKSTLLNVLGGLDKYDDGEIIVMGKSSKDFTSAEFDSYRNTYIGFIFQEYNILNEFTVGQNIALAMELQGKKATADEVNKILEEVDLADYAGRKPNELSGGQKQRVAIARALIKNPQIIMADEPTGALDSNTGKMIFDTLKKLSKDKLVVVVSHDRDFAEEFGDRVIELSDGVIISDIYKYHTPAEKVGAGVEVVDDKIIRVKKGYKLTDDDLKIITSYLQNNNDADTIISVDAVTNNEVKRAARIDDEGNREAFKTTEKSDLQLKDYKEGDFQLIKSRLPFKKAFKIGVSGLKTKPIRLFFTIILSAAAFCLFGIAFSAANYNKVDATVKSIQDAEINYLAMEKNQEVKVSDDFTYTTGINMNEDDVSLMKKKFPDYNLIPVYSDWGNYSTSYSDNVKDVTKLGSGEYGYYRANITGIIEMDDAYLAKSGYTLTGSLPTADDEVVITDYAYEIFNKCGYKYGGEEAEIKNKEDLIGKKINLLGNSNSFLFGCKITGILNTNSCVGDKYDVFKVNSLEQDASISTYMKYSSFMNDRDASFLCVAVVNHDLMASVVASQSNLYASNGANYGSYINTSMMENVTDGTYVKTNGYSSYNAKTECVFLDNTKTTLGEGEVLFSKTALMTLINGINSTAGTFPVDYYDAYNTSSNALIDSGVISKFAAAGFPFTEDNESGKREEIKEYLADGGFYANSYATKENGLDSGEIFDMKAIVGALKYMSENKTQYNYSTDIYLHISHRDSNYTQTVKPLKVVGIVASGTAENDYVVYMNENFINSLNLQKDGYYNKVIGNMPTEKNKIKELVEYGENDGIDGTNYVVVNSVISSLSSINNIIESFRNVFIYVGVGLALFASFLLMTFISTSISYKKREIGILRAVGARSLDVVGIFYNEAAVIAVINFVIALFATLVSVKSISAKLVENIGIQVTLLQFTFLDAVYMLLIALGCAILASSIPVLLTTRKKPIDAIRNAN